MKTKVIRLTIGKKTSEYVYDADDMGTLSIRAVDAIPAALSGNGEPGHIIGHAQDGRVLRRFSAKDVRGVHVG